MYKNFNLTEQERQQIMEMHQSHGYREPINEQLTKVGQTSGVKKSVPSYWKAVSAYLRNNPMMGFKFASFIENIPTQGIEMRNDNGQSMYVEVDGRFVIYNTSGHGVGKSGTWKWDGVKVIMAMDTPRPLNEEMEDVDLGGRLANDSASDFPNNNSYGENMNVIRKITQDINVGPNGIGGGPSPDNFNKITYAIDLALNKYGDNYNQDDVANALYHALYGFDNEDNTPQPDVSKKSKVRDEMPTHAEDAYNSAMGFGKPSDYYRGGGYEDLSGRDD
jgi:hypothetical protein